MIQIDQNKYDQLDWDKSTDGLLPVVIQDQDTMKVLMLGYMNKEALDKTLELGQVTFFSRSKQRLWTKGETSGNTLALTSVDIDCDHDTLLIFAKPAGPTCHTGDVTCFGAQDDVAGLSFLAELGQLIEGRKQDKPEDSYTAKLFCEGRERISQKVGEEGVEVALAHMSSGNKEKILSESADLIYHLSVLLAHEDLSLVDVCKVLKDRHNK